MIRDILNRLNPKKQSESGNKTKSDGQQHTTRGGMGEAYRPETYSEYVEVPRTIEDIPDEPEVGEVTVDSSTIADPQELTNARQRDLKARRKRTIKAFEWFSNIDGMMLRAEAAEQLSDHFDWSIDSANQTIGDLIGDTPDPVQQIVSPDGKYVGVIEYHIWPEESIYGFIEHDDRLGNRKRGVCAKCVEVKDDHTQVTTSSGDSWKSVRGSLRSHVENSHHIELDSISVAAALASPTTIGGNEAFHKGNDGAGSGLDADTVDNTQAADLGSSTAEVQADAAVWSSGIAPNFAGGN